MVDDLILPLWAIHPQPKTVELFESWIMRLTVENGFRLREVIKQLELENIFCSKNNVELKTVKKLSEATGVLQYRILESHLGWYKNHTDLAYAKTFTLWGRSPSDTIQHFKVCPDCFANQDKPHILLDWALEITQFCTVHQRPLFERCPKCREPLQFGLLFDKTVQPAICSNCSTKMKIHRWKHSIDFKFGLELQSQILSLRKHDQVSPKQSRIISAKTFLSIVERIFYCFTSLPNQQTFSKLTDLSVMLLDDRFSQAFRRINALTICGWLLADPMVRIKVLHRFTQKHVEYSTAIQIISVLNYVQATLQPRNGISQ